MQIDRDFLHKLDRVATKVWLVECTLDNADLVQSTIRNALYRARIEINTAEHLAKVHLGLREV